MKKDIKFLRTKYRRKSFDDISYFVQGLKDDPFDRDGLAVLGDILEELGYPQYEAARILGKESGSVFDNLNNKIRNSSYWVRTYQDKLENHLGDDVFNKDQLRYWSDLKTLFESFGKLLGI